MDPDKIPQVNFYVGLYHDGQFSKELLLVLLINLGIRPDLAQEICRSEALRKLNHKRAEEGR